MKIRLFHATTLNAAESILIGGFIDQEYSIENGDTKSGVFVSAYPLSIQEGARGDTVLEIVIESTTIPRAAGIDRFW